MQKSARDTYWHCGLDEDEDEEDEEDEPDELEEEAVWEEEEWLSWWLSLDEGRVPDASLC